MKKENILTKLNESEKIIYNKTKKFIYLAGVDESGAGNLAGNLVVASVILDKNKKIIGLNDSKKISMKKRFFLYEEIIEKAIDYCIIKIPPEDIDKSNILIERINGMKKSIEGLKNVDYALIDGNRKPENLNIESDFIIKGDGKFECIAAASILAKVTVDRDMIEYDKTYPEYGFINHKGYGTKKHIEAIEKYGPLEIHRMSYKPLKNIKEFK